jgi:DNA-binding SARP family transcriptional activator
MSGVRLLGPVELWTASGHVPAGPPQQRCVLAALALTPGQSVSQATLIDRVWDGEELPRYVRNALYTTVSRLRHGLAAVGGNVARTGGGYRLDIDPDHIDLHRACRLAAKARELSGGSSGSGGESADLLAAACALWRGVPLTGLKGGWTERVREALDRERLAGRAGMARHPA